VFVVLDDHHNKTNFTRRFERTGIHSFSETILELQKEIIMKLFRQVSGLLAFGLLVIACNTAPTPPSEPRFKLEPGVATLEIAAGTEASSFVALNRNAGFSDTVQMTIQNLPAGFEQEWTRDSSNGDCAVRLTIGKNVSPGEYDLNIVGLTGPEAKAGSNIVSRAATVEVSTKFNVVVPQPNGFAVTTSPTVFSAEAGFSAKFGINIKEVTADFSGNVQLSLENLPLGVTASFSKNPVATVNPPTVSSSQVTLSIATNTLPGTYAMKVVGVAGSRTRSTVVQLTVQPPTTQGFKLTATTSISSSDTFLQESQPSLFNIVAERKAGFTGEIALSVQNVPTDMRVTINRDIAPANTTAGLSVNAGFNTAPGTHTFTLKGVSGSIVQTIPVTVTVLSRFEIPEATNTGLNALDSSFTNIPVPGFRTFPELKLNSFFENGPFSNTSLSQQFASLALPDGKVLTTAGFGGQVARLNSDGTLDSSFGANGLSPQLGALNKIERFALQTDNKILVGGSRFLEDIDGNVDVSPAFARLNTNGSLDTSFGTGGVFSKGNQNNLVISQALLAFAQVDLGRILIITPKELIRLTAGGNLDPDFDTDGRKAISLPVADYSRAVGLTDSLGRSVIVTNGFTGGPNGDVKHIRVFRVLQDGTLDPSYPSNGLTLTNMQLNGRGIAVDSQDRVLLPVVATASNNPQPESLFRVLRLNANGILDTSFDTDGQAQVSFGSIFHSTRAVTVLGNNKIMVVGTTSATLNGGAFKNADFAAMRLNENGSLDTSFGTGGKFLMGFKDPRAPASSVLDPNPPLQGFTDLFGAVVGLPNNGALAFGGGFERPQVGFGTLNVIAKFKP
jgi:uncharacterized delta-60 repeat protein